MLQFTLGQLTDATKTSKHTFQRQSEDMFKKNERRLVRLPWNSLIQKLINKTIQSPHSKINLNITVLRAFLVVFLIV